MGDQVASDLEEEILEGVFLSMADGTVIDEAARGRLAALRSQGKLADKALVLEALREAPKDARANDRPDTSQGVPGSQATHPARSGR